MARNYAALFHVYLEEFADLTDAEFGRLARALLVYSSTGEFPALNGNERFFKRRVMMQEDQVQGSYESAAEKSRTNGKSGGRPKKTRETQNNPEEPRETQNNPEKPRETQNNPEEPRETQNNPEEPRETQNNPENLNRNRNKYKAFPNGKEYIPPETPNGVSPPLQGGKRTSSFVPPKFEEVSEYAKLRGGLIDPKPFFDYYAAADWRDAEGKPVRNWQQKFIAWELRELDRRKEGQRGHNGGPGDDTGKKWDIPGEIRID